MNARVNPNISLVLDEWGAKATICSVKDGGETRCIASHRQGKFRYVEYKNNEQFLVFECLDKEEMFETFLGQMTARIELDFWSFRFLW